MHDELTANDIKKMEDEIEYRKLVVRKKALDDVKVARAQGDLSENFEYKAAKQFKNQNESRIRYLEKMIKTAVVISDESKDDEVGMFNTVDVYFEFASSSIFCTVLSSSTSALFATVCTLLPVIIVYAKSTINPSTMVVTIPVAIPTPNPFLNPFL